MNTESVSNKEWEKLFLGNLIIESFGDYEVEAYSYETLGSLNLDQVHFKKEKGRINIKDVEHYGYLKESSRIKDLEKYELNFSNPKTGHNFMLDFIFHRDGDEPSINCKNISKYHKHGLLHREGDLAAIIFANGSKEYYENGVLHRGGGLPAFDTPFMKKYYVRGLLHREGNYPAMDSQYCKKYFMNGIEYFLY